LWAGEGVWLVSGRLAAGAGRRRDRQWLLGGERGYGHMCCGDLAHREHEPCERDQQSAERSDRSQRAVPPRRKAAEHSASLQVGLTKLALYEGAHLDEGAVPARELCTVGTR
jgi:hypothetical protein